MQVSCEVTCCREDAFIVFSFTLTIKLFPPFCKEMKLRLEVNDNFNLLPCLAVKTVANSCILCGGVLFKRYILAACTFHFLCTTNEFFHIEACTSDWKQANRSENREASADIIRDNETLVAFFVGASTGCSFFCISHCNDYILSFCLATLCFTLFLQQAEGECSLCSCAGFADVNDTEFFVLKIFCEFKEIVFTDIIACKENGWVLLVGY